MPAIASSAAPVSSTSLKPASPGVVVTTVAVVLADEPARGFGELGADTRRPQGEDAE